MDVTHITSVIQLQTTTRKEYQQIGKDLLIEYGFHASPLGRLFVAITHYGLCRLAFADSTSETELLQSLQHTWPLSQIQENSPATYNSIAWFFQNQKLCPIRLYLKGTDFQLKTWRALLKIPINSTESYQQLAARIGSPKAARAVGTAIGANPVAIAVPCHRVIRQDGGLGGYRWGLTKKLLVQTWENNAIT